MNVFTSFVSIVLAWVLHSAEALQSPALFTDTDEYDTRAAADALDNYATESTEAAPDIVTAVGENGEAESVIPDELAAEQQEVADPSVYESGAANDAGQEAEEWLKKREAEAAQNFLLEEREAAKKAAKAAEEKAAAAKAAEEKATAENTVEEKTVAEKARVPAAKMTTSSKLVKKITAQLSGAKAASKKDSAKLLALPQTHEKPQASPRPIEKSSASLPSAKVEASAKSIETSIGQSPVATVVPVTNPSEKAPLATSKLGGMSTGTALIAKLVAADSKPIEKFNVKHSPATVEVYPKPGDKLSSESAAPSKPSEKINATPIKKSPAAAAVAAPKEIATPIKKAPAAAAVAAPKAIEADNAKLLDANSKAKRAPVGLVQSGLARVSVEQGLHTELDKTRMTRSAARATSNATRARSASNLTRWNLTDAKELLAKPLPSLIESALPTSFRQDANLTVNRTATCPGGGKPTLLRTGQYVCKQRFEKGSAAWFFWKLAKVLYACNQLSRLLLTAVALLLTLACTVVIEAYLRARKNGPEYEIVGTDMSEDHPMEREHALIAAGILAEVTANGKKDLSKKDATSPLAHQPSREEELEASKQGTTTAFRKRETSSFQQLLTRLVGLKCKCRNRRGSAIQF